MPLLSNDLLSANLSFAIGQREVVLRQLRPTTSVTVTFSASRQNIDASYDLFIDGREETIDTRFYIDATQYQQTPSKGWVLTDESGNNYKVQSTQTDFAEIGLRLDCSAKSQR